MLPAHLATNIRRQILYYLQSTFEFRDPAVNHAFQRFLENPEAGLFKGPWVDLRRPFRPAAKSEVIAFDFPVPFHPFKHQNRAWRRLSSKTQKPRPTLVTTGTGSGKTECFLYPILDHCLRRRREGTRGIQAIILYPMNALASDQERRFAKVIHQTPELRDAGITVGNYTGRYDPAQPGAASAGGTRAMGANHGITNHQVQMESPPDILLTNYKMLDYLLLRPQDQALWRYNAPGILKYLVLDELHTYDGAQGTDVACLLRRLKERLGVADDELCVVGTSATLDDRASARERSRGGQAGSDPGQEDARETGSDRLAKFASTIFEQEITAEAVIDEDRLGVEDIVDPHRVDVVLPETRQVEPLPDEETETYVRRQAALFGAPSGVAELTGEPLALAIGSWIRTTRLFHEILQIFENARERKESPLEFRVLVDRLSQADWSLGQVPSFEDRTSVLAAFLAILSHARESRSDFAFPLVPTQVQLWIRELRRLGRLVHEDPVFTWLDEPPGDHPVLPTFHCSECGESGWMALEDPASQTVIGTTGTVGSKLKKDPTEIYRAWFGRGGGRDVNLVIFSPLKDHERSVEDAQGDLLGAWFLCPRSLVMRRGDGPCPLTQDSKRFPVKRNQARRTTEQGAVVGDQVCPSCESREGVFFVGAQSATLSSVALDELFGSTLNRDPKLLAFTDSVQDASHRAGFFTARTYRFTLRTALQHLVEASGEAGVPLASIGHQMLRFWEERRPTWEGGTRAALAALLPPDLRDDREYIDFRNEEAVRSPPAGLLRDLQERLTWEAASEFGFMQNHGRTLERVGSACLGFDLGRIDSVAKSIEERLPGIDPTLVGTSRELLVRWILGILHRYRLRGALAHPYLQDLAAKGFWGKTPFGRHVPGRERHPIALHYRPHLIVTGPHRDHDHILAASRGSQASWPTLWARRSLGRPGLLESTALDLVRTFLRLGCDQGLLVNLHDAPSRGFYGLSLEAARILPRGVLLTCSRSGHQMVRPKAEAALWDGAPSLDYRAHDGVYQLSEYSTRQTYYQDRYRKGALRRVVASEHTGLLRTEEREELESRFARSRHKDDPNVLTCTSTLEMGIDIGDLSSTMLCSVPPNTASYLQRIGRAGRATGSALIISVINQRPHDLFFFGRPFEMLRGRVDPPGCWLDASAVLVRQYLAFCFDTASHDGALRELPRSAKQMVDDLATEDGHLPRFFRWIVENELALRSRFLRRYRDTLRPDTRERFLRETAAELLKQRVHRAANEFDRVARDLENARKRLREQRDKVDSQERDTIREIDRELMILKGRLAGLGRTSALELMTDHGLLPNYAFPERGVRFYGSIYSAAGSNQDSLEPIEVTRPAGAAIRELAPFNHFYSHSRHFEIQQIAIGNPQQPLTERWAICGACGHMRRVEELMQPEASPACPQCGHDRDSRSQSDHGQHRQFIEFSRSQALSHMEHFDSLSVDKSDERERESYNIITSFDVSLDCPVGAVGEDELPFGIEYRESVIMRDVNAGTPGDTATIDFGAEAKASEEGFRICKDCGIAARRGLPDEKIHHRRSCRAFRKAEKLKEEGRKENPFSWENVYLYRQLRSEAVRLLLPIADPEDLDTMTACLHLGLRLRFEGDPTHLLVRPLCVPDVATGLERYFLVILDGVPGGTGYLKTLYQLRDDQQREGEGIVEVLRLAKNILETCPCRHLRQDPRLADPDGCYRCIRTYHLQYRSEAISRERGITLLGQLIQAAERRESRTELASIRPNQPFGSQLERSFVKVLEAHVKAREGEWTETLIRGKRGFRFRFRSDSRVWDLELQASLGQAHGVEHPSKPDFLLTCDEEHILPVAIFTDGYEYHVHPNNRLRDDIRKRRAILDSGRYRVWSVTWEDLLGQAGDDLQLEPVILPLLRPFVAALRRTRPIPDLDRMFGSPLQQLTAFLDCPEGESWKTILTTTTSIGMQGVQDLGRRRWPSLLEFLQSWARGDHAEMGEHLPDGDWLLRAGVSSSPDIVAYQSLASSLSPTRVPPSLILRMPDRDADVLHGGFKAMWRRNLACMNLYQFLDGLKLCSTMECLEGEGPDWGSPEEEAVSAAWESIRESVTPSLKSLVDFLARAELPEPGGIPRAEHFLDDQDEEVFAELAWPDTSPRIAVLAGEQATLASQWQAQGWNVITVTELAARGQSHLAELVRQSQGGR